MKKLIQIIFIPIILLTTSYAQPSVSLNFATAIPIGEFKDYTRNIGFGGNMELFFFSPSQRTPYGLGINLSYISYGVHFLVSPYSNELSLSMNRANNFASAHILFQIAPPAGTVRPYFETLFGGSYIFSITDVSYDYYYPATIWIDDWAWSYGAGVGLKLFVTGDPLFNSGSAYFDFKIRYLFSTSANYLDRNSIEYYSDEIYYSVIESKTDMLTVSVGFYFYL